MSLKKIFMFGMDLIGYITFIGTKLIEQNAISWPSDAVWVYEKVVDHYVAGIYRWLSQSVERGAFPDNGLKGTYWYAWKGIE